MKKIKNLFLLTMLFALCSCGNSIDSDPAEYSQQVVTNGTLYNIKSKMDGSTYKNCSVKLSNLMNTINTRSLDAISDSAQIYLKPFVNDGKTIQKEILSQLSKDSEEYKYYQSLNDEQLASLSFLVYHIDETTDFGTRVSFKSCLSAAIGLTAIKELSVKGIVTATSLRRALFAVGKRYLGYIGVALMVADFYECVNS